MLCEQGLLEPCVVLVEVVLWSRKLKLVKVQKFGKPCGTEAQERSELAVTVQINLLQC